VRIYNPTGYTLCKVPGSNPVQYEFRLAEVDPLTFLHDGLCVQPDRHEVTDMGSIPRPLQPLAPKDRYLLAYILHDSAYHKKGLYFAETMNGPFQFAAVTRRYADGLLYEAIRAEGGASWRAWAIYSTVRLFGSLAWA